MREGIVEPVARSLAGVLRAAVLDHARSEHRRSYPARLWVGHPLNEPRRLDLDPTLLPPRVLDDALRTDMMAAMVARARSRHPTVLVWVTRPGEPDQTEQVDLDWLRAVRAAGSELGLLIPFVIANRRSWCDPRTGVGRSWVRLRER